MFFAFFLHKIYSEFVPFNTDLFLTDMPKISIARAKEISKSNMVFSLAPNMNNRFMPDIWRTFHHISNHYGKNFNFTLLDEESSLQLSKNKGRKVIRLPSIFIFENSTIKGIIPCETSEYSLLSTFHSLLSSDKIISSPENLYSMIGNSPFSIISPPSLFNTAKKIFCELSLFLINTKTLKSYYPNQIDELTIIQVSPELLHKMNISEIYLSLYRNQDRTIVPFNSTMECLLEQTKTFVSIFHKKTLTDPTLTLFALTSDEFTDEMFDFLYKIGESHPNLTVGFLPTYGLAIGEDIFGKAFEPGLGLHIFNPILRYQYITHDVFTPEFLKKPFKADEWHKKAEKIIAMIANHQRNRTYISEPIPRKSTTYIKKIVGKTYADFINDSEHDVIMLYKRTNCSYCQEFLGIFEDFAVECENNHLSQLIFGMIDVTKNSSPLPYPYLPSLPHVEIFPAKNKSAHSMLRGGKGRDSLLRLILKHASLLPKKIDMKVSKSDTISVKMNLYREIMQQPSMPPEEEEKFRQYIEDVANEYSIDVSDLPGFSEFHLKGKQKLSEDL